MKIQLPKNITLWTCVQMTVECFINLAKFYIPQPEPSLLAHNIAAFSRNGSWLDRLMSHLGYLEPYLDKGKGSYL